MARSVCMLLLLTMTLNLVSEVYQVFYSLETHSLSIFKGNDIESGENESKSELSDNEEDLKYNHHCIIKIVMIFDALYFSFMHKDEFLSMSFVARLIDPPDTI